MTDKILYWATMVSAALALLLFVSNACLINGNSALQSQINQRQNIINIASNVLPLNQQLSNALYEASIKTDDADIRALLVAQGFTLPSKADKTNAAKVAQDSKTKKATAPTKKIEE
ncbi:MAG: hypothetical protein PHD48_10075 [Alphaproteobacteria bacterium]|nr:hypothetical protein [Alphaproteobacteria bacterium]